MPRRKLFKLQITNNLRKKVNIWQFWRLWVDVSKSRVVARFVTRSDVTRRDCLSRDDRRWVRESTNAQQQQTHFHPTLGLPKSCNFITLRYIAWPAHYYKIKEDWGVSFESCCGFVIKRSPPREQVGVVRGVEDASTEIRRRQVSCFDVCVALETRSLSRRVARHCDVTRCCRHCETSKHGTGLAYSCSVLTSWTQPHLWASCFCF